MGIVVKANGGLGNRMRVLASCIALQKRLRQEIEVIWVNNAELNCSYDRLFLPVNGLKIIEHQYVPTWNRVWLKSRKRSITKAFENYDIQFSDEEVRKLKRMKSDLVKLIKDASTVYIDTCESFYGDESHLAFLLPQPPINAIVEQRLKDLETSTFYGVHIRRGDNQTSTSISTTKEFIARIKLCIAQDKNSAFFLCTDDKNEALQLLSNFPERIKHYPVSLKRNRPSDIEMALVDLMLLSKSIGIFGSYWSSFSEVAAAYGGVTYEAVGFIEKDK